MVKTVRLIAEIGSVHDGSFGNAKKLIESAARHGADIVKFQTHIAEAETTRDAPSPAYFSDESRYDYFERTGFNIDQWKVLKQVAADNNVGFMSSPFSLEAVDLLEEVGVDSYKVASGEVTNLPLLHRIAKTGKEALLSSGMSNWAELDAAVEILKETTLTVFQCASIYPCPPEKVGLNVIAEMQERYNLPVGYSDHTNGVVAAIAAVVSGATMIEKHFTFSKEMYGSDAANAMEPHDFEQLASYIQEAAAMAQSSVNKDDISEFADMKKIFEKSIVAAHDIEAGSVLEEGMLRFKKPGSGISAAQWKNILGKTVTKKISKDEMVTTAALNG